MTCLFLTPFLFCVASIVHGSDWITRGVVKAATIAGLGLILWMAGGGVYFSGIVGTVLALFWWFGFRRGEVARAELDYMDCRVPDHHFGDVIEAYFWPVVASYLASIAPLSWAIYGTTGGGHHYFAVLAIISLILLSLWVSHGLIMRYTRKSVFVNDEQYAQVQKTRRIRRMSVEASGGLVTGSYIAYIAWAWLLILNGVL